MLSNDLFHPPIFHLIEALDVELQTALFARFRTEDMEELSRLAGDEEDILHRHGRISEAASSWLFTSLCSSSLIPQAPPDEDASSDLITCALAFPVAGEDGHILWKVPLEVRCALYNPAHAAALDLPMILALAEPEESNRILEIHQVSGHPVESPSDWTNVATKIGEGAHLEALLDSLNEAARSTLCWVMEHAEPVSQETLDNEAILHLRRAGTEGATLACRILVRMGLLFEVPELDDVWCIPSDLRLKLAQRLEHDFSGDIRSAWKELKTSGTQGFRHLYPRGLRGNIQQTLSNALLQAIHSPPNPNEPVDRILSVLHCFDLRSGDVGDLAADVLDVSSPEVSARKAIRRWLTSLDDLWTRSLLKGLGADTGSIAQTIIQGLHGEKRSGAW